MIQVPVLPTRCCDCRAAKAERHSGGIARYNCRMAFYCHGGWVSKEVYDAGGIPEWCPLYNGSLVIQRRK